MTATNATRADGSSAPACSPVWRKMTPEEYAAQYLAFGPHRATIECEVINEAASAAVSVCLLGFVDTANPSHQGTTHLVRRTLDGVVQIPNQEK